MRLKALHAKFLSPRGRKCMGVMFRCPKHPTDAEDVVVCWFDNPVDGGERMGGSGLFVHRLGDEIDHLSLLPAKGEVFDVLSLPHWRGWVVDGEVKPAR